MGKERKATASFRKSMAIVKQEKRRFPRLNLKAPVRYQIRGAPEFNNVVSEDISLGGISFINNAFIPPQTTLALEINLLSKILNPIARIAWSAPLTHSNRFRTGVEFLEWDSTQKNFLSDYINLRSGIL